MSKIRINMKKCMMAVGSLVGIVFLRILDDKRKEGFSEGTEVGITNTIMALYDAGVEEKEMCHALYEYWRIPKDEAQYRIAEEISHAVVQELRDYMRQLSWSDREIDDYMELNDAVRKIRRSKELWKLKCRPEELMKAVQKSQ